MLFGRAPTSGNGNTPYFVAVPSPRPVMPWQTAQLIVKYFRPRSSDAESAGTGFGIPAIESMVAGRFAYETAKPGTVAPVIGTEVCGFPRTPAESRRSHVTTEGCRLKSVNHSQPASGARSTTSVIARRTADRRRA